MLQSWLNRMRSVNKSFNSAKFLRVQNSAELIVIKKKLAKWNSLNRGFTALITVKEKRTLSLLPKLTYLYVCTSEYWTTLNCCQI